MRRAQYDECSFVLSILIDLVSSISSDVLSGRADAVL